MNSTKSNIIVLFTVCFIATGLGVGAAFLLIGRKPDAGAAGTQDATPAIKQPADIVAPTQKAPAASKAAKGFTPAVPFEEYSSIIHQTKAFTIPKASKDGDDEWKRILPGVPNDKIEDIGNLRLKTDQMFHSSNERFYYLVNAMQTAGFKTAALSRCFLASFNNSDFVLITWNGYKSFPNLMSVKDIVGAAAVFGWEYPQLGSENIVFTISGDVLYTDDESGQKLASLIAKIYGTKVKLDRYERRP